MPVPGAAGEQAGRLQGGGGLGPVPQPAGPGVTKAKVGRARAEAGPCGLLSFYHPLCRGGRCWIIGGPRAAVPLGLLGMSPPQRGL